MFRRPGYLRIRAPESGIWIRPLCSGSARVDEEQDMYAVIETGGKQHRVKQGEVLKVEKLEVPTGNSVEFDRVLLVGEGESVKVGAPLVAGGKVTAEVVSHGRGDKITIIKMRRRKHYRRQAGHRQWFTEIRITGISAG